MNGRRRMEARGFTLIELLVVIGIIGLLAAMLAIAMARIAERARVERTIALVHKLETSIQDYHEVYLTYPPSGGGPGGSGIENLFHFLCNPLQHVYFQDPRPGGGSKFRQEKPILTEVSGDELKGGLPQGAGQQQPRAFIDAWMQDLSYAQPGTDHSAADASWANTSQTYDLFSTGAPDADGYYAPDSGPGGNDIANWKPRF